MNTITIERIGLTEGDVVRTVLPANSPLVAIYERKVGVSRLPGGVLRVVRGPTQASSTNDQKSKDQQKG